jgi:hypothetical protein
MIKCLFIALFFCRVAFADQGYFFIGGFERGVVLSEVYRPKQPLMWSAKLKVDRAVIIAYEKQIYSLSSYLEFYGGVSFGFLQKITEVEDKAQVTGGYLLTRLYFLNKKNLKLFFLWSPAGPSLLSKNKFSSTEFSNRFVFQDQFGIGGRVKGDKEYEIFAKLYHFSNGSLFPINGGIDIPLLVGMGVRF